MVQQSERFGCFNTQPPEGGWLGAGRLNRLLASFNTQPPEGGWGAQVFGAVDFCVSTHSRPKAAAGYTNFLDLVKSGFNTQPPEGGCSVFIRHTHNEGCFNTQPPEGGCRSSEIRRPFLMEFQHTAARRRLLMTMLIRQGMSAFQHTAARRRLPTLAFAGYLKRPVSTHSRPKAAAHDHRQDDACRAVSTHSRPKAAVIIYVMVTINKSFQHTAARRRLTARLQIRAKRMSFQHTAARRRLICQCPIANGNAGFNTQPPEGGWRLKIQRQPTRLCFNTQPPEGG